MGVREKRSDEGEGVNGVGARVGTGVGSDSFECYFRRVFGLVKRFV